MFNLKNKLKSKLVDIIRNNTPAPPPPALLYGDSYWYAGANLWEPTVILALRDLCKPGTTVFDVGGNMGGLTSAMSRLVGPKGVVCTFEASPRIIGYLQGNITAQGHNNVYVYHRAVYSKSNETIMIYDGDHLNDSIFIEQSPTKNGKPVKTLALDDFCDATGLAPDLIKMDIEGAEYEALLGASKMIVRDHPHFLLEQQATDMRCFEFLADLGYVTIDLSNYRQVCKKEDYPEGAPLRNVLCIHKNRLSETSYSLSISANDVCMLGPQNFEKNHMNGLTSKTFQLEAGRYLLDVDFVANGVDNSMMCGVRCEGLDIFRYHGYSKLIAGSYREWVIDLPRKGNLNIYFDFQDGSLDPTFQFRAVSVKKLNGLSSPLWSSLVID
ncbi:MAG: FkbM family methyltransferase [Burkholderiales bacterium]|nr:FkbM family methyltransferase [Burkholderiales bacterium]